MVNIRNHKETILSIHKQNKVVLMLGIINLDYFELRSKVLSDLDNLTDRVNHKQIPV